LSPHLSHPEAYARGTKPDRTTLEMCLGASACALGMVMAGTGELSTLRLLRELRLRSVGRAEAKEEKDGSTGEGKKESTWTNKSADPGKYSTYGHHQAIGSAIGLLFLGGGRATLSRSNESIAALVVAFFPRYPLETIDNRYHLQALRHLYVLAVDYRVVNAVDIDTGASCLVPLRVEYQQDCRGHNVRTTGTTGTPGGGGQRLVAPCLLPEAARIAALVVDSPRHWPIRLSGAHVRRHLGNQGMKYIRQGLTVYVKRKQGCLPYSQDPYGQRSLAARRRKGGGGATGNHQSSLLDPDLVYVC
jgi:anaphase-promoting complex subunit 1